MTHRPRRGTPPADPRQAPNSGTFPHDDAPAALNAPPSRPRRAGNPQGHSGHDGAPGRAQTRRPEPTPTNRRNYGSTGRAETRHPSRPRRTAELQGCSRPLQPRQQGTRERYCERMFMNMRSSSGASSTLSRPRHGTGTKGRTGLSIRIGTTPSTEFNGPLLAAARIAAGERILDVGCGNGQLHPPRRGPDRPGRPRHRGRPVQAHAGAGGCQHRSRKRHLRARRRPGPPVSGRGIRRDAQPLRRHVLP